MELLRWKTRIAVLWLFLTACMSASMILAVFWPGMIEDVMAGKMEGWQVSDGLLIFFGLFWLIPLVMAVLSLTLKDKANRWTNFIVGLVFTIFWILHPFIHLASGMPLPLHQLMFNIASIVSAGLVTWWAWKWPTQEL